MSFPRQYARTRGFSLGRPRAFTVAPDGGRVLFLRSRGPRDPVTDLWSYEHGRGERRLAAAEDLVGAGEEELPPEERARRERAREASQGIVGYACDRAVTMAAFAVSGRLFRVDVARGDVTEVVTDAAVFDPRPDPTGAAVGYHAESALWVAVGGTPPRRVAGEDTDAVSWGRAEFVAAEEMGRSRGFWWSPDGTRLAVARVDERPVAVWHLADPAAPEHAPRPVRYPAAGAANAEVTLHLVGRDGGATTEVAWDRAAFPYLARVVWNCRGLLLLVQARDQRRTQVLAVADDAAIAVVREDYDDAWLDLVPGVPDQLGDGRLVTVLPTDRGEGGTTSLVVDGDPVTPAGLQVRAVADVGDDRVTFTAANGDPTQVQAWQWHTDETLRRLTPDLVGLSGAAVGGATAVVGTETVAGPPRVTVHTAENEVALRVATEEPLVAPAPQFLEVTARRLPAALLLPRTDPGGSLPVLLDPYGGPHGERVVRARNRFLVAQWFADQGFAVLVVDGRGMPNRGPAWERTVRGDLATAVLEDQVDALQAVAERHPRLDLGRVAIRGWSFGGFLAALAVLRRPDVFHAAVAGAPVTDWRLYDTHYTERYLGMPVAGSAAYRASSLVDQELALIDPAALVGPPPELLLIHGLADDNVVAAHSLRLSHALLAAGRPHRLLPLTGVTHMTPQEVVAENLLLFQRDFLRDALA